MLTFPALLYIVPEPRRQRLLVPLRDAEDLNDALGAPDDRTGWAVGCRLIDADRRIYALAFAEGVYDFQLSAETLDDTQLRQLMSRNRSALGRDSGSFEAQTRDLSDKPLFDAVVDHASRLPELRPSVRALGLVAIVLLVLAALVLPALLLLRLLP